MRKGRGRVWGGAWLLALVVIAVCGGTRQIEKRLEVSDLVHQIRRSVRDRAAVDGSETMMILREVPRRVGDLPAMDAYTTFAFRDPFEADPLWVRATLDDDWYFGKGELYSEKRPARVLVWRDGALVPETPVLPAPKSSTGRFVFLGDSATIDPPVTPRAIQAVQLGLTSGAPEGAAFDLVFHDDSGQSVRRRLTWAENDDQPGTVRFDLKDRREWLFMSAITRVTIEDATPDAPRLEAIAFDAALPEIELVAPAIGADVPFSGDEPVLRFRDPTGAARLRIQIYSPVRMTWVVRRDELEERDGVLGYRMSMGGTTPAVPGLPWSLMARTQGPAMLDQLGVDFLTLLWSVEAMGSLADEPQARSPSWPAHLVR